MSRIYIQPSWIDSCTGHTEWSGQSPDDRKRSSHMLGEKANIEAYADKNVSKKGKHIRDRILPAQSSLNRVDQQEQELDKAYESGEIDQEEYEELLHCLEGKRQRAHKALCKAIGKPLEDDPVGQHTLDPENVSESLKTQNNSYFLLKSGGRIEKNVKADALFFFTGAIICFTLLLWITN